MFRCPEEREVSFRDTVHVKTQKTHGITTSHQTKTMIGQIFSHLLSQHDPDEDAILRHREPVVGSEGETCYSQSPGAHSPKCPFAGSD
jgi:hypothetical protein